MDTWSSNLEDTFRRLTSGSTDLTGADVYKRQFQSSLDGSFTIKKPDAEKMLADMAAKVTDTFRRNIEAVKVEGTQLFHR